VNPDSGYLLMRTPLRAVEREEINTECICRTSSLV
jgi:hypothetical protein